MSRGLGKVQRQLLVILRAYDRVASLQEAARGLDTIELASWVYYGRGGFGWVTDPTQLSAVRRALAGLMRQGLVFRLGQFRGPRCRWRAPPLDMVLATRQQAAAGDQA